MSSSSPVVSIVYETVGDGVGAGVGGMGDGEVGVRVGGGVVGGGVGIPATRYVAVNPSFCWLPSLVNFRYI